MKINTVILKTVLQKIDPCVLKSDEIPILKNVLFNQQGVFAYNLQSGCFVKENIFDADVCVSFAKLKAFLYNTKLDEIECNIEDGLLSLKAGRSSAKIPIDDSKDFPDFAEIIEQVMKEKVEIANEFLVALKMVEPFSARKSPRLILQGINVKSDSVWTTDSKTLSWYNVSSFLGSNNIVIPREFVKIVGKVESIFCDDKKVAFVDGGTIYFTNLITGDFPDLSKYIFETKKYLKLPKEELKLALKKVGDFSEEVETISECEVSFGETIHIKYEGKTAEIEEFFDFGSKLPKVTYSINPFIFSKLLDCCDKFAFDRKGDRNILMGVSTDNKFHAMISLSEKE